MRHSISEDYELVYKHNKSPEQNNRNKSPKYSSDTVISFMKNNRQKCLSMVERTDKDRKK